MRYWRGEGIQHHTSNSAQVGCLFIFLVPPPHDFGVPIPLSLISFPKKYFIIPKNFSHVTNAFIWISSLRHLIARLSRAAVCRRTVSESLSFLLRGVYPRTVQSFAKQVKNPVVLRYEEISVERLWVFALVLHLFLRLLLSLDIKYNDKITYLLSGS